jgi:L-iditol 2-dehydrogenase
MQQKRSVSLGGPLPSARHPYYGQRVKALVLQRDKELVFEEVSAPSRPGPDWVLLKVAFAGICNSDLHRGFGGGAYHYPLIMGHEFSATVAESFPGSRFSPGDVVTAYPLIPCLRCSACREGNFAQCVDYDYLGSRRDGAFAELVWAPEANLFRVPPAVDPLHAALTEPCAVALHAVSKFSPGHGSATAAVFGAGPIGNMAAQWLRARRLAGEVLVVDVDRRKLELARSLGFTPIDAAAGDPVVAIRERTGGAGADRTIEAVGLPATYRQSLAAAARGGEVVLMGNIRGELALGEEEVSSVLRRELTIRGTWNSKIVPAGSNEWTEVLDRMASLAIAPLVSHVLPLERGAEAFRMIVERTEYTGRVVLQP